MFQVSSFKLGYVLSTTTVERFKSGLFVTVDRQTPLMNQTWNLIVESTELMVLTD